MVSDQQSTKYFPQPLLEICMMNNQHLQTCRLGFHYYNSTTVKDFDQQSTKYFQLFFTKRSTLEK